MARWLMKLRYYCRTLVEVQCGCAIAHGIVIVTQGERAYPHVLSWRKSQVCGQVQYHVILLSSADGQSEESGGQCLEIDEATRIKDEGRIRRVFAFQSNDIDAFHGNRQRIRPIMRILPIYTQRSTSTTSSYVWDRSSCLCKSFEMFPFSLINGDAEFICVQVSTRRIYTQSVTHAQARAQTGREPDRQKTDTCNRMRGGLT